MKISNTFFYGYFKQKTTETGRSMVEILGVLAVIGVLSIGGIYGYTFAMDKYRANDIVYEVNLRANDVWHKYQEQPLPDPSEDGTDFDEFPDMTGTGYPIYMTSHPDIAFKTYVEGVSSRVCKNVVNMNLNGIVQGIQFVQVAQGEGDLVKYTGNASICGEDETDNLIVFTSFIDSDTEKSDDNQNQHCVEEGDCSGLCAPFTCDNNMVCRDKCYNLDDTPYCYDDGAVGQCVACTKNEHCASYGDNYVCNTSEHTCQPLRQCVDGEYRAKSGACIPCTDVNAIEISLDKYNNLSLSIKDDTTGQEQCNACNDTHTVTIDEATGVAYCAVACIRGVTYESENEGCIPCRQNDGTLNATRHRIPKTEKARYLCEACDLKWTHSFWYSTCGLYPVCDSGQFLAVEAHMNSKTAADFICKDCTRNEGISLYGGIVGIHDFSNEITKESLAAGCNNCPEYTNGVWSKRKAVGESCWPVCQAGYFQSSNGTCYLCTDETSYAINTGGTDEIDTEEEKMCIACNRIVRNGYCLFEKQPELGEFRGKDGNIYPCNYSNVNFPTEILDEADSRCVANCRKKDGKYSNDADAVPVRKVRIKGNKQYCDNVCSDTQWKNNNGNCYPCSTNYGSNAYLYHGSPSKEDCEPGCLTAGKYRRKYNSLGYCVFETCPSATETNPYYQDGKGYCRSCNGTATTGTDLETCSQCPNRIYGDGKCALIVPGESGVCNSDNWSLPTTLASDYSDLYAEVQEYVRGEHDGLKFRNSNDGLCYDCTTEKAIPTTQKQCNLCNTKVLQRTYSGGVCSLGGCQTNEFMNNTPDCVKCTPDSEPSSYINATYQLKSGHTATCGQCGNRQVLTVGSNGFQYCVPNVCITGSEWQSANNGKCQLCQEDNAIREIGTEAVYRQQCEACNRVAFSQDVSGKTVWYCSKQAGDGYFIDSSGNIKNCSTAGDTQIVNTIKARNICEASGCNRVAQTNGDGTVWCMKE